MGHDTLISPAGGDSFESPESGAAMFAESTIPHELERRIRQQQVVVDFSRRALSGEPADVLFQEAIDLIADMMDMKYGRIFETQPDIDGEKYFKIRAVSKGFDKSLNGTLTLMKEEPANYALERGENIIVKDFEQEKRFERSPLLKNVGLRCGMMILIHGLSRPFGTLTMGDDELKPIHPEDISFVESIANVLGIMIERQRAEAEARAADERYRLVLDGTSDGLYDWDLERGTVFWSDQYYRMIGLKPGEIEPTYENFIELIHPEDRDAVSKELQLHLKVPTKYVMEYRIRHKDGHYLNIVCRGRAILDEQGKATRMSGLVRDITFEKGVEQAVRDSERRFRTIADASPFNIWTVDNQGRLTYYNRSMLNFIGANEDQAIEQGWEPLIHPDDLPKVQERFLEAIRTQSSYEQEFRLRRNDGEFVWMLGAGETHRNAEGDPIGFVGSCVEIHSRKMLESRTNRMFQSNIIGVVFWNRAGFITDANDAFLEMIGYTRDELERGEVNWLAMTPPEFAHLDQKAFEQMAEFGVCTPYEKQYIHKDGERIDIQLGIALMEHSPDEGVAYIQNITERKRSSESLEYSLQRETLNRRILEIISQPEEISKILSEVADEVGRFLGVDRCVVVRYEEKDGYYDMVLTSQYAPDPKYAHVNLDDLNPELMEFIAKNIRPEHIMRGSCSSSPREYQDNLYIRLGELGLTEELKQRYLEFFCTLLDRYQTKSTLQVGVGYQGRPYASIALHQCSRERVWTQEEKDLLNDIAKHMGLALFQSELFAQEQAASNLLKQSNALLDIISSTQNLYISNEDIYDMFEMPLNSLLNFTGSEYGFIGEILHTPEGRPYLKCNFLTNIAWDEATRKLYEENRKTGFEFHKLDNLFGLVITTGEVIISNDPDNDPRKSGRPAGHPPLKAFLGMPFYKNGEMVGMVGLANRPTG